MFNFHNTLHFGTLLATYHFEITVLRRQERPSFINDAREKGLEAPRTIWELPQPGEQGLPPPYPPLLFFRKPVLPPHNFRLPPF